MATIFGYGRMAKNWKIEQNIIFINLSITLELKRGKKRCKENREKLLFNDF
jgi:hypothetical protein